MPSKTTHPAKPTEFAPSPAIVKRARQLQAQYSVALKPDGDGGYIGTCAELPGVLADGRTLDACARNLAFAMETVVATYLVEGRSPPTPATREKRTEQVNVRFTPSEKTLLERESARQGFRGVGDLVRAEVIRRLASPQPSAA
jgi:predicted RNase H-like HicB family nuclease